MRKILAAAVIAAGAFGMIAAHATPGDSGTVVYASPFASDTSSTFSVDASTKVRGVVDSFSGTATITHRDLNNCTDPNDITTCAIITDWSGSSPADSTTLALQPGIDYTLALTSDGYGFVAAGSPE
jgi:hypothetical protein